MICELPSKLQQWIRRTLVLKWGILYISSAGGPERREVVCILLKIEIIPEMAMILNDKNFHDIQRNLRNKLSPARNFFFE